MGLKKKKTIALTAGSFDMLHSGHIKIIERTRKLCDFLIVAVSSDKLIKSYKNATPIMNFKERAYNVSQIKGVDLVVSQDTLIDVETLKKYNINLITIGSDWRNKTLPSLEWAKTNGIKVVYLPYTKGISTTSIKEKIIKNSYKILKALLTRELNAYPSDKKE